MGSNATTLTGTAVKEVADLAREALEIRVLKVGDYDFSNHHLERVNVDPALTETLEFYTLEGFIAYLKAEGFTDDQPFVHVVSPTRVDAISPLTGADHNRRVTVAKAICHSAGMKGFSFNNFFAIEALSIALQTCFVPEHGDIQLLRTFASSVKSSQSIGLDDDGVSQTVEARKGIASVQTVGVRNPWDLAPYRTFPEVPQPLSPFVLRFKDSMEPTAGLFETGDARWQVDAVKAIARYLRQELEDFKVLG